MNQEQLVTRSSLVEALIDVGVSRGDILCVHSALSPLGYVCGGARTVIEAVTDAVGPEGTVMMPSATRDAADPREWMYPPAPQDWLDRLVAETPPFDPLLSPPQNVGAVAELFRTYPNVLRSCHPISSATARGPQAAALTENVPLKDRFGEDSPYGRLVRLNGKVLMLAAPYGKMSLMHLSEYRMVGDERVVRSACMMVDGKRAWVEFQDVMMPHDWLAECLKDMIFAGVAKRLSFGKTHLVLVNASDALDFTVQWRLDRDNASTRKSQD